jgi:hypothetical protein
MTVSRYHNAPDLDVFSSDEKAALDLALQSWGAIKKTFDHWMIIMRAVRICRARADGLGGRNAFKRLMAQSGLGQLVNQKHKSICSHLLRIADHEAEVRSWHGNLPEDRQWKWAAPSTIITHCPAFTKAKAPSKAQGPTKGNAKTIPTLTREIERLEAHVAELEAARSTQAKPTKKLTIEEHFAAMVVLMQDQDMHIAQRYANKFSSDLNKAWKARRKAGHPVQPMSVEDQRMKEAFREVGSRMAKALGGIGVKAKLVE